MIAVIVASVRAGHPTRWRYECPTCLKLGKWTTDHDTAIRERNEHNLARH
jgi:hypothetical protein